MNYLLFFFLNSVLIAPSNSRYKHASNLLTYCRPTLSIEEVTFCTLVLVNMPKKSTRRIKSPSRFCDEKFEETAPYDRCLGGYVFPKIHKDRHYRQPKRDKKERLKEDCIVNQIRGNRSLDCNGYLCDNFVAADEDEEEPFTEYTILDECENILSYDTDYDDSFDIENDGDQDSSDETEEDDEDFDEEDDDDEDFEYETSSDDEENED